MHLPRHVLHALAVTVLLVSACSSDEPPPAPAEDTAGSPPAAIPSETAVAGGAVTADVSQAPIAPAPDEEREESGGGGTVDGIDLDADYCEIAEQAEESGLFSGEGPQTPEDLANAAERTRRITNALVRQAPDEIASEAEVSARSLSDLLSVLEGHASRTGEVDAEAGQDPDVQAALDALGSQEVQSANDRVDKWRRENC